MSLLTEFYSALRSRDPVAMGSCYHPEARFQDPVFPDLDAEEVRAMWTMLLKGGTDLKFDFDVLEEHEGGGRVRWDAYYTFSSTGRKVHNRALSQFQFKDGKILWQTDSFSFWRWSRQALGPLGWLLGWTPLLRDRVRARAASKLRKAMAA